MDDPILIVPICLGKSIRMNRVNGTALDKMAFFRLIIQPYNRRSPKPNQIFIKSHANMQLVLIEKDNENFENRLQVRR